MEIDTVAIPLSAGEELRHRAETQLSTHRPGTESVPSTTETLRLLHELEIHRIELVMQNSELRQARDEAESNLERYTAFYDFAPVGYFTLDRNGCINSVNIRGASHMGVPRDQLLGHDFGPFVVDEHRQLFTDFLDKVFKQGDQLTCEVTLQDKEHHPFTVLLKALAAVSRAECGLALVDITERKRLEGDLHSYASRLIVMEEELRNKLATELHDDICRDLTVLGLNLAIIGDGMAEIAPKKMTSRLKVSEKLVKSISHTVRSIMVGLRPPGLEDFGLLAALRWHAELFTKRTGIQVCIQANDSFPRLMLNKETALFRICQEALMNMAKHAAAKTVTIKLTGGDGMILLEISDAGRGFIPPEMLNIRNGSGWGIRIMRERAELIGGKFRVDSVPGKGTTVSVIVPFEER